MNAQIVRINFNVEQQLDAESSTELTGIVEYALDSSGNVVSEVLEQVDQMLLLYSLNEQGQRIGEPREYIICTDANELTDVARMAALDAAFAELLKQGIVRIASIHELERL